jgi:hypothetical protein
MPGACSVAEDRAALVARLAELIEVLIHPEVVELASLLDGMARAHGLAPSRKAAR